MLQLKGGRITSGWRMQQVKSHWKAAVHSSWNELRSWETVTAPCRLITERESHPPIIDCQCNAAHSFCWALVNWGHWCLRADISTIPYEGQLFFKSSCPANLSAWGYSVEREVYVLPSLHFQGVTFSQLSSSRSFPCKIEPLVFACLDVWVPACMYVLLFRIWGCLCTE